MNHCLDRAIWDALNFRQTEFSLGSARAKRFHQSIGPLAAAQDDGVESLKELAELVRVSGSLTLLQADPVTIPDQVEVVLRGPGVQMVLENLKIPPNDDTSQIERLHAADIESMMSLASLTKPGPFEKNTPQLGDFWGVKENGRLLAMAGERMRPVGYCEVSGVCVHPEARGRGFARLLSAHVALRIQARGDIPFLHSYAGNTAAIRLYESLGFQIRCEVELVKLQAPGNI